MLGRTLELLKLKRYKILITLFFILVSGLRKIVNRKVEFRDF
jgi:hypothetical protein